MSAQMFEASLTLPKDRREAQLLADNMSALAKALRDWPVEAWQKVDPQASGAAGLFERLVASTQPAALDAKKRTQAMASAEAVADVLRVLWPQGQAGPSTEQDLQLASN
jgi:hypothetical protein